VLPRVALGVALGCAAVPLLPPSAKVELEIVRDRTPPDEAGFLRIKRLDLAVRRDARRTGAGRAASPPFPYDIVERTALDATVMLAHHVEGGRVHVWLRTAQRPPVVLRPIAPKHPFALWEAPAGLVEPGEEPRAGAARELEEELGFRVAPEDMVPLGPYGFPAPGFVAEIHYYFQVRVDPAARREPAGDGSPLEEGARVAAVPLEVALEACRRGEVPDLKTELALRRLAEALAG
jgi:ADP-ribose pyrophosphatase